MTLSARVLGIAVWGPGLEGWQSSRTVLAGISPYVPTDTAPPPTAWLPPAERRRSGPVVRLALAVAHEAVVASGAVPGSMRAVFGSSNGDGPIVCSILGALAKAEPGERVVSPTQFHNSVHNAPAGYWSIATGSRQPATCIGCHDETWAASLLAALADLAVHGGTVLLCCYDHPLPAPMDAVRPSGPAFGTALVLGNDGAGPLLAAAHERSQASCSEELIPSPLRALARMNPAARALPLLATLARNEPASHDIAYLGGRLRLQVQL